MIEPQPLLLTDPLTWALVLAALVVLLVPGAALCLLLSRQRNDVVDAPVNWSAMPALSVAFWPLLLLYLSLVGLAFSALLLWVVLLLLVGFVVWSAFRVRRVCAKGLRVSSAGVSLVGLGVAALLFRLGDISGLVVPLFGDSLHHTMITQIIINTGQVPHGYMPYVPVDTFTYHFGFHTLSAALALLTGAGSAHAVLIMGQVLIAASLLSAFFMGRTLFHSAGAGLISALLTGFASAMPAYYVNWGRYTQLAGQVLLPVAIATLVRSLAPGAGRGDRVLAAFCVAGLAVVHYRILIFYALFAVAYGLVYLFYGRNTVRPAVAHLFRAVGLVVLGLVAAAPWLANVITNYFPGLVRRLGTVSADYIASYNSADNLRLFVGFFMAGLGLLGLVVAAIGILRPKLAQRVVSVSLLEDGNLPPPLAAIAVVLWVGLELASMWVVPGAIGSYTVAISLYLPLSALGGFGIEYGLRFVPRGSGLQRAVAYASPLAVLPLALAFGTWHLVDTGGFSYVHEADLEAFSWIREHTPPDAKFLISSEFSYAGRGVTASDAGMWVPLLTGRNVSVPALASWTERPLSPDFFTDARLLAALTQPTSDTSAQALVTNGTVPPPVRPSSPVLLNLMQKMGINYVYSGSPEGRGKPRLDLAGMTRDACHYKPVYKLLYPPKGAIYIFRIDYSGAGCK